MVMEVEYNKKGIKKDVRNYVRTELFIDMDCHAYGSQ
jgi:hypothetical protein